MTRFHIIMPAFNAEATIHEAIQDVRKQSHRNWIMTIVDDGSSDRTVEICEQFAKRDDRIQIIQQENAGPTAARNRALFLEDCCAVAFMDADDRWASNKLAVHDAFFRQRGDVGIAFGRIAFFKQDLADAKVFSTVPRGPVDLLQVLAENPTCTCSNLVVRMSVFYQLGSFKPGLNHAEDQEWLVRAVADGVVLEGIQDVLVGYRASQNGQSADLEAMYRGWESILADFHRCGMDISKDLERKARAIFLRYLARRALRLGQPPKTALTFALKGVRSSFTAFFHDLKRGILTLCACSLAIVLPTPVTRKLFAC